MKLCILFLLCFGAQRFHLTWANRMRWKQPCPGSNACFSQWIETEVAMCQFSICLFNRHHSHEQQPSQESLLVQEEHYRHMEQSYPQQRPARTGQSTCRYILNHKWLMLQLLSCGVVCYIAIANELTGLFIIVITNLRQSIWPTFS